MFMFSSCVSIFFVIDHHLIKRRMSICQTVTALSVNVEAAGGVVCRPLGGCLFSWFLIIIFDVQFDVLISSSVNLAEQSSEFLHFRNRLPPAGTSLSVREIEALVR